MKKKEELEFVFKHTPYHEKEVIFGIQYIYFRNKSGIRCFCPLKIVPQDIFEELLHKYQNYEK